VVCVVRGAKVDQRATAECTRRLRKERHSSGQTRDKTTVQAGVGVGTTAGEALDRCAPDRTRHCSESYAAPRRMRGLGALCTVAPETAKAEWRTLGESLFADARARGTARPAGCCCDTSVDDERRLASPGLSWSGGPQPWYLVHVLAASTPVSMMHHGAVHYYHGSPIRPSAG
jgi:hypothetical protein